MDLIIVLSTLAGVCGIVLIAGKKFVLDVVEDCATIEYRVTAGIVVLLAYYVATVAMLAVTMN